MHVNKKLWVPQALHHSKYLKQMGVEMKEERDAAAWIIPSPLHYGSSVARLHSINAEAALMRLGLILNHSTGYRSCLHVNNLWKSHTVLVKSAVVSMPSHYSWHNDFCIATTQACIQTLLSQAQWIWMFIKTGNYIGSLQHVEKKVE